MELRHLRYFVTVAELLNFTGASRRLRVAQPALSRQIRDLEEELRVRLLERDTRPVRLTEAGAAFLPEARAVLRQAEQAIEAARAVARGERGEIHVGYAPTPTIEILPCTLHTFQNDAPEVKVTLHDLSTEEMLSGLHAGSLNLCLMIQPSPRGLRGLKFELLRQYAICAALRPGHPLTRHRTLRLEQLADEPLLAYSKAEYPDYHAQVEQLFAGTGRAPKIVEEHDSGPGILAAAEIGRGWLLAPSCLAIQVGKRLELRPIQPPPEPMAVGALYAPRRFTKAAARFVAAAQSACQQRAKR